MFGFGLFNVSGNLIKFYKGAGFSNFSATF